MFTPGPSTRPLDGIRLEKLLRLVHKGSAALTATRGLPLRCKLIRENAAGNTRLEKGPMPIRGITIPLEIILPHARKAHIDIGRNPERWTDYEVAELRGKCGPNFGAVPLEDIKAQCCDLRKKALLPRLTNSKNRGAAKRQEEPPWYQRYLLTPYWKAFRLKVLAHWDYRCTICDGDHEHHLEVHHRTYDRCGTPDRPGTEKLTDCCVLCRRCHKLFHRHMNRDEKCRKAEGLFAAVI
jgi:hypothetical protein